MNHTDLELLLLKHIQAENYRPVKPRVITKQLGFPESRRAEVRKAIKRLAKQGVISYGSNHLVTAARAGDSHSDRRSSAFSSAPRVASDSSDRVPRRPTCPRTADIYIPASRTSDASSGDLVRVRLGKRRRGGDGDRPRGEIVEVLERETHQFVGTYKPRGDVPLVQVDGKVFRPADSGRRSRCQETCGPTTRS